MKNNKFKKSILIGSIVIILALAFSACGQVDSVSASSEQRGGPQRDPAVSEDVEDNDQGQGIGQGGQGRGSGQGSQGRGGNLQPLSEEESTGLLEAIEEELGAAALYESVMQTFQDADPFNGIYESELNHADALIRQADKYGIDVPDYQFTDLPVYETLQDACAAGVQAEILDAELYDEIMVYTDHEDLLRVYENLHRASLENHLPMFEDCD